MKKTLCYSLALGGVLVLSGCNGKMNQFKADYFTTNPNPLEVSGELVPATVTGNIPAKFFKKNAEVTVVPVLVYNGQEAQSAPVTFQGEKVRGNNPTISVDGGTMTIPVSYVYQPEMIKSELYLSFNVQQGNKQYVLPRVKVADGVIATAALADVGNVPPALTPDAFQRIIKEKYTADIRFLINQDNVREGAIKSDGMVSFNEQLRNAAGDTTRVIEELNISSYASPEGALDFNTRLAENREKNTKTYLEGQLKKDKIAEFGELTAQFTPEDWEGFQELVSNSNIQDKELILSVLSMYKDPEQREKEIRNLSSVFEVLADEILPQLRRSRLTASVNVIGKSDAEINQYINSNPSALNVEEMLYAATLTDDENRKAAIYQQVIKYFPNDYRGYNNLGMSQFKNKDYQAAAANFNKAANLAPQSREVKMNQGLIAMANRDYATANRLFGNAAGLSELNDARGLYLLKSGNTADAAKAFAGSKTNNAALAQLLNKDYSAAQRTLSAIATPDATTYYLSAVLGARTNNSQMVSENLRKAINLDRTLAAKALNDLEFAKFDISNIVK